MRASTLLTAIIVLILAVLLWPASSMGQDLIATNTETYQLGDLVRISIFVSDYNNLSLSIESTTRTYQYVGNFSKSIVFKPDAVGAYKITLMRNDNMIAEKNISVQNWMQEIAYGSLDNNNRNFNVTNKLQLDRKVYELGDLVRISLNGHVQSLRIDHREKSYEFSGNITKELIFRPQFAGPYRVEAVIDGVTIDADFIVNLMPGHVPEQIIDVRDRENKKIEAFVTKVTNYSGAGDMEDVELVLPNSSINRILFNRLNVSSGINLKVDKVEEPVYNNGKKFNRVFAIDASNLNFRQATISVIATGSELFKCKNWNFESGVCSGTWQKIMDIVPGREYNLTIGPNDPGFGEANITIINVQSYPVVGGQWTVRFNTTGIADLKITPFNGTTWSGPNPDLMFLGISCGNISLSYEWINSSVIVRNYSCSATGYETSKVLTTGKHILQFVFGDDIEYAKNLASGAYLLLFTNETSTPTGWSCESCSSTDPFYNRFPRGNRTYGSPGGAATHTHTISLLAQTLGASVQVGGSGGAKSTASHVHPTISSTSVSAASNYPLYRALRVIVYTSGLPQTIPRGAIAIFNDTNLPSGWTRYSLQDGRFVLANSSMSQTGGASNHTHAISYTVDASGNTQVSAGSGTSVASSDHTHSVSGTSNRSDHRPPYTQVILARANADTSIPKGLIAMFNASPTDPNWKNMSNTGGSLYGRFIVGASTFGSQGGSSTHANPNTNLTSGTPSTTTDDSGTGIYQASGSHTHRVTVSFSTASNLPPYINVIFAYANKPLAPPVVTLNDPRANYLNSTVNVVKLYFNCSIKDDFGSKNLSLMLTNKRNLTLKINASCNLPKVNSSCKWLKNLTPGNYTWNCLGYDNTSISSMGTNRTIVITQTTPPTVRLLEPGNRNFSKSPVLFHYNATSTSLDTCQLWANFSGSWKKNQTNISASRTSLEVTKSLSLKDGTYKWNAWCNDSNTLTAWYSYNRTVFVDSTFPLIKYAGGTPANNTITNKNYIFINVSAYDLNEKNITFYLYNTTKLVNATTKSAGSRSINFTKLASNKYFFNVTIVDKAGNKNVTPTRTITLDYVQPYVAFAGGTAANNSFFNRNYFYVNVTFIDQNKANLTFYLFNSSKNLINVTTKITNNINFTKLNSNMAYFYNVSVIDKAGNRNKTPVRKITLDSIQPYIAFAGGTPQNNTYSNKNYIYVNVTINDANEKNITFYLYNTTKLVNATTKSAGSRSINFTKLASNKYFFNVTIVDRAGNKNVTPTRTITLDNSPPNVVLLNPTPNYNVETNVPIIVRFNCSVTDNSIVKNLSLYLTAKNNRTFRMNGSCVIGASSGFCNLTRLLSLGNYTWNCLAYDNTQNFAWSSNRTIILGLFAPKINSVQAKPNSTGTGRKVRITANVTDLKNVSMVLAYINDPDSQTASFQMTLASKDIYEYNYTAFKTGKFFYYVWANDTFGASTTSSTKSFNTTANALLTMRTVNETYKSKKYVNLTNNTVSNWWNTSFSYRQAINVTVPGGSTLKNFQVMIRLNSTNVGANFDWSRGCSDLRFVNGTNKVLIPYWTEDCDSSDKNATIWVKVDVNITTSTNWIYMYYGNGAVATRSNGTATFEIFDDFDDGTLDTGKWTTVGSGVTELNGYAYASTDNAQWKAIRSNADVPRNSILEMQERIAGDRGGQATQYFGFYDTSAANPTGGSSTALPASTSHSGYGEGWCNDWGSCAEHADGSTEQGAYIGFGGEPGKPNEVYFPFIRVNYTSAGTSFWIIYSNGSYYKGRQTANTPSTRMDVFVGVEDHDATYGGMTMNVYWLRVRKSDSPEPRHRIKTEEKYKKGTLLANNAQKNLSGYLLMQVKFLNQSWKPIATVVNDTKTGTLRTISPGSTLNIAKFWNANPWNTDLSAPGTYRAYGFLTDNLGKILKNSDGTNITGNYTFTIDYLKINVKSPLNKSVVDATGFWANITLSYVSYPSGGWCAYSIDNKQNKSMQKNTSMTRYYNFTSNVSVGGHTIRFYCNDSTHEVISSDVINFTGQDLSPPVIRLVSPTNQQEMPNGNVTFYFNVSDVVSAIKNCTLEYQYAEDQSKTTIKENVKQNFTKYDIPNGGPYWWRVICYDNSNNHNRANSSYSSFIVGYDTDKPVVHLKEPSNGYVTSSNDIVLYYRADDPTTYIKNCSLILNGKRNQTKTNIVEQGAFPYIYNNFTLSNLINKTYVWSVNCTDTAYYKNTGSSEVWNFTIIIDSDYPQITLVDPADMYTSTSVTVVFYYTVNDASSNIKNCSLFINNTINKTSTTVLENEVQSFTVNNLGDGKNYAWKIRCTDDSFQQRTNTSQTRNVFIRVLKYLAVNVTTYKRFYEKGTQLNETVCINTNVTDQVKNKRNASVTDSIIMGNTSAPWWNYSFTYRQQINLTTSSGSTPPGYQLYIKLNSTNVGSNFNWSRNCNDIRFATHDIKRIAYWVETCNSSRQNASIWIRLDNNITTKSYFVYMYYGNSQASSKSNASAVFELYDDFEDGVLDTTKWSDEWGGVSEELGYLYASTDSAGWKGVRSKKNFSINSILEFEFRKIGRLDGNQTQFFGFYDAYAADPVSPTLQALPATTKHAGLGDEWCSASLWSTCAEQANGTTREGAYIGFGGKTVMPGENYFKFAQINYTSSGTGIYLWNGTSGTFSAKYTTYIPKTQMDVMFAVGDWRFYNSNAMTMYIYWMRVRKYTPSKYFYKIKSEQKIMNQSFEPSIGIDGSWQYCYSTSRLSVGWHSGVSYVKSTGYVNATNFTLFKVIVDQTAPVVYLITPLNNNISYDHDVTFYYNVTDLHSAIKNCSILLNNTINQTNTSVVELTQQRFTLYSMRNGNYNWTVRCYDDSSNRNVYTAPKRKITIALDTLPPKVTLVSPKPGYNDTNGNLILRFNVTDNIMSTADCSLYLNGTRNLTKTSLATGSKVHNFTLNLSNGFRTWFVNCSDTSMARNYNISKRWNFTVMIDTVGPIINLRFPDNGAQLTNENVTLKYNVTDLISNVTKCSLYINRKINKTNYTIVEGKTLNFTLRRLNGWYNWSVNCTDGSENKNSLMSETRSFLVAPDNTGPVIYLVFPPDKIELYAGNITFYYNVTDFASGVANCSLYLNDKRNITRKNIIESKKLNMSTILGNNNYLWYINCTDDSANHNYAKSATRNLTIGEDKTPPTTTLIIPVPPYNDTDGNLVLIYQTIDYASAIKNCSLVINGKRNQTDTTVFESVNQNFTINSLGNGFYTWRINCTDNSSNRNKGTSALWNFTVTIDTVGPTVALISPPDNTIDSDGNRIFYYNVTDAISGVMNCSLVVNNKLNKTNSTRIVEAARLNFTLTGLSNGQYNWSVNCTDNSDNRNRKGSETRHLTVLKDTVAPVIYLVSPADSAIDNDGNRTFFFNVTDNLNNISYCTLAVGSQSFTNYTIRKAVNQTFKATGLSQGTFRWNVTCADTSDNANKATSASRTILVRYDFSPPVVLLRAPANYTQSLSNTVIFYYNVTDVSPILNCTLVVNSTVQKYNNSIKRNVTMNFTLSLANGAYWWRVNCTDTSEKSWKGASQQRILIVGPDTAGPVINLVSPPNNAQDTDGNVTFEYNVSDFASGIANCSLVFNGKLNKTTYKPPESTRLNFTLKGLALASYTWRVNCTDNSSNKNRGSSELRNLTVGQDQTPPEVTLKSPTNNSVYNDKDVSFDFQAYDYSSGIANCSLIINGKRNQTMKPVPQQTTVSFYVFNLSDGYYNWRVNCTDTAKNTGSSLLYKVKVVMKRPIMTDVYTNQPSYQQGAAALVTVNTTNGTGKTSANVYVDIIRGNGTAAWWSSQWKYRVPLFVNSTNMTRTNPLLEYQVNFTKILATEIGNTSVSFDINSVRVIEWQKNKSKEIISQFEPDPKYNKSRNAFGTVYWLMNGTVAPNTVKKYYIYFDVEQSGSKSAAYSSAKPSFSFKGNTKSVSYDGSTISADRVVISKGTESFSLQFGNGNSITNQQNIDYPGAGSIWNITVNRTRLMNYYDSIVPIAVYDNYFFNANKTSVVSSGAVISRINMQGYINASPGSKAYINYTIWFTGLEIVAKANLFVQFSQANNNPISLFNNLWFAYLFDYESSWNSYLHAMNSSNRNQTHNYHFPGSLQDTTNRFNRTSWYTEYFSGVGSVNFYAQRFLLNSIANTIGVVSFDDYYSPGVGKTTESDGVGLNYNQDQQIAANDRYNLTVWMLFSRTSNSGRAVAWKNEVASPMTYSKQRAETFVYRQTGTSSSAGTYSFQWSTALQKLGWYSAAAIANKSLFSNGFDYQFFQISQDVTAPTVYAISPSGWINYSNVLFTYNVSDSNPQIANCSLMINNRLNRTNKTISNNAKNYFRITLAQKDYNWSVNCTDAAGNIGASAAKTIRIDTVKPSIILFFPANAALINYSRIDFNFTAKDNRAKNLTCDLFLNAALYRTVVALNATRKNITMNVSDGVYTWYIRCVDWALNRNFSETRALSVDTAPPVVQLISPLSPNNYDNDGNLTLVYKPYDTGGLKTCILIINKKYNQTNHTDLRNNLNNNFSITKLSQAAYNWSVNCTDIFGRVGYSSTGTFYVDLYKPSIQLYYPLNGVTLNYSNVKFNFTVTDSYDKNLVCNLTIDGVNEKRNVAAQNGSVTSAWVNPVKDGSHLWNVSCWDHAGNKNTSKTRSLIIQEPPTIALDNPKNNTWYPKQNITFFFNVSDSTGIKNCTLTFDGKVNGTKTVIRNNFKNNITRLYATETKHNWSISCYDNSTQRNFAKTATWIVRLDFTKPIVSLYAPQNNVWNTSSQIKFAYYFVEINPNVCQLYGNFSGTWKRNNSNVNPTQGMINQINTTIPDGSFKWNIRCNDSAGNFAWNNTNRTLRVDATPPKILLKRPTNNYWDADGKVIFNFTFIEKNPSICQLWGNFSGTWKKNQTLTSPVPNVNNVFNEISLNEGFYKWNVWCNDSAKNSAWNSTNWTVVIDTKNPHLALVYPKNGSNTSATFYFNFTASDTVDKNMTCNLTVDNKVNKSKISAISAQFTTVLIQNLAMGRHTWSVLCWDHALHYNQSLTYWFNVSIADLVMLSSNIRFNTTKPQENVNITVNATILNTGGSNAYNVQVKFFERKRPSGPYLQIDGTRVVNVSVGKNATASIKWTPKIGTYEILVAVDPANLIKELYESNNNASKNITTSSWHTIIGNTTGTLMIGDSANYSAYRWQMINSTTSNIFVADSDSIISWLKLVPISRNTTGSYKVSDFAKIDTILGSTNFSDSVNRTYVPKGQMPSLRNFTVFKRLLSSVPVVNSTNTSKFVTGILWDSSDLQRFDYNGTQDIVFITKVNIPTMGAFKVVDYEIKVPAYLRKYKTATMDSVTFYTELK